MLVFCDSCHDQTDQELLKVEVNSLKDTRLLTTYLCKTCNNENYGTAEKSKFDTTKYPVKPLIPEEHLEEAIKGERNWKPRHQEFKIENNQYFIADGFDDGKPVYESVSKDVYFEDKFQHKFQLEYHDAKRGSSIIHWEYPPVNYQIDEDCELFGHDFDDFLLYEDQYGLETFPEFLDNPDMVFVSSKRGQCTRCNRWHITVFPDKLREWYFQKKFS